MNKSSGQRSLVLAALVALVWPAVWLAWYPLHRSIRIPARPSAPRVVYVRQTPGTADLPWAPMIIALPTSAGYQEMQDPGPDLGSLSADRSPAPPFLRYGQVHASNAAPAVAWALERPAVSAVDQSAFWPEPPRQTWIASPAASNVVVTVSPELQRFQFQLPDWARDPEFRASNACSVVARVELEGSGYVKSVFLETPADQKDVNAMVIRSLFQGRALRAAEECSGLITFSFPGKEGLAKSP